jgi:hypothetical protein
MPRDISNLLSEVADALAWPFDFAIDGIPDTPLWFSVRPPMSLTPIAGEGAGGIYASLDSTGEILFVNSEGSGSIVAPNLESLLLIFVCHPYWRDLLKFSGGGSLREMRRTLPFAAHDFFEDVPEVIGLGAMLRTELHLPGTRDMVDVLHASVASSGQRIQMLAPDGSKLTSLFNEFTAMDNPAWREKAEQSAAPDGE